MQYMSVTDGIIVIYNNNKRGVADTIRTIFISFFLIFHLYQCGLCKPDTFLYVKQMQGERTVTSLQTTFLKSSA